jgi:hypothetical protein
MNHVIKKPCIIVKPTKKFVNNKRGLKKRDMFADRLDTALSILPQSMMNKVKRVTSTTAILQLQEYALVHLRIEQMHDASVFLVCEIDGETYTLLETDLRKNKWDDIDNITRAATSQTYLKQIVKEYAATLEKSE